MPAIQHHLEGPPQALSMWQAKRHQPHDDMSQGWKGGYVHLRHNQIRDIEAKLLSEVCHDVVIEPPLLPLTGKQFPLRSTNEAAEARLDVSARGVWRPMDKVFFDIRIFHPTAACNAAANDPFRKHEMEKKRTYNQRVIDVEKATFIPLVFSTNGGRSGWNHSTKDWQHCCH